jgi:hypothetical protein
MSIFIIISGNYTLSLQVKKVRNLIYNSKSKTNTKDKHFGIKEQYSYVWLLNEFGKLNESMNWIRNTTSWNAMPYFTGKKHQNM